MDTRNDTLHSWKVVTPAEGGEAGEGGVSGEVVVAVDFPVTGRPEAGFTDLAGLLAPGRAFWQTVPPPVVPGSGAGVETYVGGWADELTGSGLVVRGILGFCVGSVYAAALADKVTAAQGSAPALILFDPEPATVTTLYWQFEKMVGNLAGVLTDDEADAVRRKAEALSKADPDDVTAFAAELHAMFHPVAVEAFGRLGLDAEHTAEVLDLFAAFISYLSVAGQLDPSAAWKGATAISSAGPNSGLNPHRAHPGQDSDLVAREYRLDVPHAELLRSADAARTVDELLRG